ncbi:MAG: hypothetical protein ACXAC8_02190 [Candidatus Hodarchaeales archaeon]
MARGNAAATDQILLKKLNQFERPVTINELATRLNWNRGKIDGAINRLHEKNAAVIIKVSSPRGQRRRYVGMQKVFTQSFYKEIVIKQRNILVSDPNEVLKPFDSHPISDGAEYEILKDYQKSIQNFKLQLDEKDRQIKHLEQKASETSSRIDPDIIKVIEERLDQLNSAARKEGLSPAQILKTRISLIADPNFASIPKIISIILEEREKDTAEGAAARSFLRRAGHIGGNSNAQTY